MNILLTEIRSLNLELSGLPEVAPEGASSFARLFQQQLPVNSGSDSQAIDYKGIYSEFEIPVGAPVETLEIPQAAAWREYLAQDPVRISSDSMPQQSTPVNLDLLARPAATQAAQPAAVILSPGGELLPRGGKTLPGVAPAQLSPGSGQVRVSAALSASTPMPQPQIPAAATDAPDPAVTRDPAPGLSAKLPRQAAISAKPGNAADQPVAPAAEPLKMEFRDAAKLAPALDTRTPVPAASAEKPVKSAAATAAAQARPAFDSGERQPGAAQPLPAKDPGRQSALNAGAQSAAAPAPALQPKPVPEMPPALQTQPAADTRPAPAPFAAARQAVTTLDSGQARQSSAVMPEIAVARASVGADGPAGRADVVPERRVAADQPAAAIRPDRSVTAAVEITAASEPRDFSRIQQPQAAPAAEPNLVQNTVGRAADAMPSITAAIAPTAAAAPAMAPIPPSAAPAISIAGESLPPQLEVLQLSRQAGGDDWGNGLGERVQYLINQKQNSAMIRLDPPALGKLDVQVKIAEDSTTITIQTQHAQTRDLIETASHRLRDFLQESGYQNVNVDVSHRQDQQQARAQTAAAAGDENAAEADAEQHLDDGGALAQHDYLQGEGLLDTFA